jgi:DNA helicase-2/ATP-dependent DNA helicase PcrA
VAGLSLLDAARSASHGAVATLPGAARKKLASFVDIVDGLRDVQGKGASVAELIIQAAERSGYRERLEIEDTPDARERLQNLSELVSMATEFDDETGGRGTLVEFDERISLASANDAADGRGAAVSLMTIHAAKGLEFPVVLLCGLEDGLFPQIRPRDTGDESRNLEEERRLAYVALTRARDRLVLTCARTRRQWAEVRFNQPSRFLDDIPASCLAVRAPSRPVAVRAPAAPPMAARVRTMRRTGMDELAQPYYDDFDQRSHHDEVNGTPLGFVETDDEFGAGATVLHASFGEGRVVESRGSGRDRKLVIAFRDGGLKTILARFVEPGSN